jgi:hypothetical protein
VAFDGIRGRRHVVGGAWKALCSDWGFDVPADGVSVRSGGCELDSAEMCDAASEADRQCDGGGEWERGGIRRRPRRV